VSFSLVSTVFGMAIRKTLPAVSVRLEITPLQEASG